MRRPGEDLWFFKFYRQRLANLRALSGFGPPVRESDFPGSFLPDQFVLAAAGLESLAGHWARLYQVSRLKNSAERLGRFLVEHGGAAVFNRCSIPHLFDRLDEEQNPAVRKAREEAIIQVPKARTPPAMQRCWDDDPNLDQLARAPSIVKAGISREWLRQSRYGEILYKELRCQWVHELDGPGTTQAIFTVRDDEPRYDNIDAHRRLVFPLAFLLKSFEAVIDSFAERCERDGKSPP